MAWRNRGTTNSGSPFPNGGGGAGGGGAGGAPNMVECKVIMVGTVSVGKTSLTARYVKDVFRTNVMTTIGASYMWKIEKYLPGSPDDENAIPGLDPSLRSPVISAPADVKFSLWDTAGQEQFHSLVPMYFRDAEAAVLVVDATSPNCISDAEMWLDKIRTSAPPDIAIVLAVNKIDLARDRQFTLDEAQAFCDEHQAEFDIESAETSAKTGEGVRDMYRRIGERCLLRLEERTTSSSSSGGGGGGGAGGAGGASSPAAKGRGAGGSSAGGGEDSSGNRFRLNETSKKDSGGEKKGCDC